MPDPLVIFGSGGHAKVVADAVLARTPERRLIILDDAADGRARSILGISVSGDRHALESLGKVSVIPAVGNNRPRADLLGWLDEQGHVLEAVIHPSAIISPSAFVEPAAFVSAGAIVMPDARIASGAIVNTGASVDHDCFVGKASHIAPGVHLCGNVRVGDRTLVGVGSAVRPNISIAEDVVLGAGSVVIRDIQEAGTFAGNPAKRIG